MKTTSKGIWIAATLVALATVGCKDPIGSVQIALVGTEGKVSFEGNPTAKDGVADGAQGFSLEEGYAAVVDVNVVEGDPLVKGQDGKDYPEVIFEGIDGRVVSETKDKRWLVWLPPGAKIGEGAMTVSVSDKSGSVRIPVRVRAQVGAGPKVTPEPWPYGNGRDAGADSGQ